MGWEPHEYYEGHALPKRGTLNLSPDEMEHQPDRREEYTTDSGLKVKVHDMPLEFAYKHPIRDHGVPLRMSVYDPADQVKRRVESRGHLAEHPEGEAGLVGYTDYYHEPEYQPYQKAHSTLKLSVAPHVKSDSYDPNFDPKNFWDRNDYFDDAKISKLGTEAWDTKYTTEKPDTYMNIGFMNSVKPGVGRLMFDHFLNRMRNTPHERLNVGKVASPKTEHMAKKAREEFGGRVDYKIF